MKRIYQLFKELSAFRRKLLAGAAAALGAAIVTGFGYLFSWGYEHYGATRVLGIMNEPPAILAATAAANASKSCGSSLPGVVVQAKEPVRSFEYWRLRTSGSHLAAVVSAETGYGTGSITGYQKLRDGGPQFDTIVAAFSGKATGRGVYYLQRNHVGAVQEPWWRGWHTLYDCDHARSFKCPYLLGPETMRNEMLKDKWLGQLCIQEPLTPAEAEAMAKQNEQEKAASNAGPTG